MRRRQPGKPPPPRRPRSLASSCTCLRWPVAVPVRTSFGTMHDRPMVLVRVEDDEGAVGWGEVWCNFPTCGAEHRARIVETRAHAACSSGNFRSSGGAVRRSHGRDRGARAAVGRARAVRAGDRRHRHRAVGPGGATQGLPLWRLLGGARSGDPRLCQRPQPGPPERLAARKRAEGYTAFKLKVGFGAARDAANLRALRSALGAGRDADGRRQPGLGHATAVDQARRLAAFGLGLA